MRSILPSCFVAACLARAVGVRGEASDDLLGSTYKPTTDVDSIINLTPLLEAIALEPTKEEGQARYQQMENGMSLESLAGGSGDAPSIFFNTRTNPLYSIYMYAYWRSPNGSGSNAATSTADQPNRGGMSFLTEPVDYYGHTIIQNELTKTSAYDASLTAETIRVTNVWMATVQALYDAVQTCDNADGKTVDVNDPTFVNPVDQAAAFWFGSLDTVGSMDGGTMYAWAQRTKNLYTGGADVNAQMIEGLKDLQTMLGDCLTGSGTGDDDVDEPALEMRVKVDDMVRIMTVPLVQNLILRASQVAIDGSDADSNEVDYMILYGLATLPPIRVCDESTFNDLWGKLVYPNVKENMNTSVLNSVVQTIYDRLICLGITCDQIGVQSNPKAAGLPTCTTKDVSEDMKVDLDVRTIGTLIEMDAKPAAYDVYHWGRHVRDDVGYYSMQTKSIAEYHAKNEVGTTFNTYFAVVAGTTTNFADEHEYKAIMGLGDFTEATPTQRRIIAEASMVLINLHAFAIDSMYHAVDYCKDTSIVNQQDEAAWDRAVASLTGWAEGAENAKGVLFTEIPKYMCDLANQCAENGNSEINNNIIQQLEAGKTAIQNSSCDDAEAKIGQIEKLIKTALLDVTAYFADLISKDTTNKGNLAEGYGVAVALVPWANKLSPTFSSTIERNMGKWGQSPPFPDGINMVMDAIRQIVSAEGIDCDLLTQDICGGSSTGASPPSTGTDATSLTGTGSTTSNENASAPLLGNQYVPTTNIDHITILTDYIEQIANNNIKQTGETQYKKLPTNGFSLESLGLSGDDNGAKIQTNPLYSIFMYAYWRSKNGSGAESTDGSRDQMKFLNNKVDNYGHTIIQDELTKSSEYNGELTAETISVMNMWMATVQAMYDAVEMCDEADDDDTDVSGPNPIDKAAAFWFGHLNDMADSSGGSLYAWTKRTKANFILDGSTTPFDVNDEMVKGLKLLQSLLKQCIAPDNQEIEESALKMRILVDDLVKYMTVPLVQNLIHHAGVVVTSTEADANEVDYMILYALAALPPIRVCDEYAFNDMWEKFIFPNAKEMDTSILYNALNSLYSRLICLGVKCDYIGSPSVLANTNESWPSCQDPIVEFKGYQGSDPTQFVEEMKVDMDVRTIGSLIEMDARPAAYDVYHWGRHVKNSSGDYYSMQTKSTEEYHEKNEVGTTFNSYFANVAGGVTNFADEHEYKDMMALGDFTGATPTQRRIIAEASMVLINLHAFAINCMYRAVDYCRNPSDVDNLDEVHWDRAVASLTGWAEETEDAEGFLFIEIARYLCQEAGTCVGGTGDSQINSQLMSELQAGKTAIQNSSCDDAEAKIAKVQTLLLTILFDVTAYFADLISKDTTNKDNLAEGYGVAVALVPLVHKFNPSAAATVEKNMGKWNVSPPFPDGKDTVMEALKTLVSAIGTGGSGIDCNLLTQDICGGSSSSGTGTAPSSPGTGTGSTSSSLSTFDDDEFNPSSDSYFCGSGIDGGVPNMQGTKSSPLLGGAYTPTSNVDHITKLTDLLKQIEDSPNKTTGLQYYRQLDDEISLRCLSSGTKWLDITESNPLYVIFMYGLWVSDDGGNDNDGYSNKVFDDGDILHYGDTIVNDEMSKSSGFDAKLSAETIRVMNMWMAMTTELYRAANSCRDGYVSKAPQGFNPVDYAAAFWYGTAQNPDLTDNGSLYAWAKKAENLFIEQSMGTNDAIRTKLNELQEKFTQCKSLPKAQQETEGIAMKHIADDITRWMTVPIVQNFIHHLAAESGMGEESDDERNYMVLYALTVFPFISICDEDTFDDLYSDLITNIDSYDTATFMNHIKTVQDRFTCLGITCDMVGKSNLATSGWPECKIPSAANTNIAGYSPTSDESLEMAKIDLDISTILSFIIMEANDAAFDIYENGRNARDETMNLPISLKTVSIPESHPDSIAMFNRFSSDYGQDYTSVTKNAITKKEEFMWASVLKSSAAASLAIATIDLHMSILDNMFQATDCANDQVPQRWDFHWDNAVALTVGWSEGTEDGGSSIDGYLFFQLADELCAHFDKCDSNGKSVVNKKLMDEFKYGQDSLKNNNCFDAKSAMESIQLYLQAILVDNLAFHSKFADSNRDETHCLMAHVAKNALVPLIRPTSADAAEKIETNVGATAEECIVDDANEVYSALKTFVDAKGIDCSLLGSSVCQVGLNGNLDIDDLDDLENNSEYTSNIDDNPDTVENESYTILNGEYTPLANVEDLHQMVPVSDICTSTDKNTAKMKYESDETAGITIKSMSISAKFAMAEELQFNQYVYALQDNVDKTSGGLLFDGKPATEYANTITSDALDTSTTLGCRAVKVLNIWMWVVHKLNDSVEACKGTVERNYGVLDEAAALWESGLLFEMAENLGPKFGHTQINGMTLLNRQIVDRLKKAQAIISASNSECSGKQVHDLRIIVKETISYMTAVLFQSLIDDMLAPTGSTDSKQKQEMVELMAFAVLPQIKTCGHEAAYESLYKDLVTNGLDESLMPQTINVLQDHYNCLGLTCGDVGRHTSEDSKYPSCSDNLDIAGYIPVNETKTNMIAKLDLDAVAIHQMLSMDKYGIGKRIYLDGHNFYDYDNEADYNFVSLYNLTQSHTIDYTQFPEYSLYETYLGADFSNQLILQAFDRRARFESTTAKQRDLAVNIAISSMVSYMAALEALYYSIFRCEADIKASQTAFDGGVALLIGSVEGRERGGSAYREGRMLYSLGKRACDHFHSCRASDAEVNLELFRALEEGQTFLKEGNCVAASKAVEAINSLLKVPLIQSLLYFSDSTIAAESDDDAAAYVAAMAVLPTLNSINSTSADSIKTAMDFTLSTSTSDSKMEVVQSSLSDVFATPKAQGVVDCELVTKIEDICFRPLVDNPDTVDDESEVELIKPEEPMPISNGLYVSNNYVGDRSSIALDIKEIEERLKAGDFDEATHFYAKGLNSKVYSENGIPTGEVRAVARFSTESGISMKGDPTYNLFIYGLSDSNNEFMGKPVTMYADSFISDMLYLQQPEASKAMVAVTMWMQVANRLHSAYGACKNSFLTDGRSSDGRMLQTNDPGLMLDEAAAYWIGDNQDTGSASKGHLLYALTEFISAKFERTPSESESNINTRIIDLFNKAKNHIKISKGCSTSEESHLQLKEVVDELIPLMAVPLLRCLLYYISIDDPILVKVYAVAFLPLFSACAPSVYNELKSELIDNNVIEIQKKYIYSKIQSMYNCLGLTCSTVGRMVDDDVLQCSDNSELQSLAGYQYATLQGRAQFMDVEMRKVDILIDNGINHFPDDQELLFGTAFDLYKFGENPGMSKISLSKIARETNRDIVPKFDAFERYFSNDENYADTLIVNAFRKTGAFATASVDQRKRVISFALKYMVTYMAVLEKIHSALDSCKRNSRIEGGNELDTAAGYFIGSLEGKEDGGSFDGQLIFMLAKRMCVHFGTCAPSNNAEVNERIINLFYAAQGEVETGACDSLERTIVKIENIMIVPLIQATLVSALENQYYFDGEMDDASEFYPEGYVLAQSILPLINKVDQTAAKDIEDVMVKGFPGPDHQQAVDYPKVFRAVQTALSKMSGVDCKQIGRMDGKGFCPGDDSAYEGISSAPRKVVPTVMVVIAFSAGLFSLY